MPNIGESDEKLRIAMANARDCPVDPPDQFARNNPGTSVRELIKFLLNSGA